MEEKTQSRSDEWPDTSRVSLRGLYTISVLAMGIGIAVVFVLNFATPTGFILDQFAEVSQMSGLAYGLEVGKRLLGIHRNDPLLVKR